MKFFNNALAAVALSGLTIAPIAAQAAAPAPRVAASTEAGDKLHGHAGAAIAIIAAFGVLLVLAEVTGLIDVFNNDKNHPPVSP